MGKPKVLELTEAERLALEKGFRLGEKLLPHALSCCVTESRWTVFCSSGRANGNEPRERKRLGKTFQVRRNRWIEYPFWQRSKTYHGLFGRGSSASGNRARQIEREQGKSGMGASLGQRGKRLNIQTFFISIGARYKRIRKRPRGVPSPQLYEYKVEKLQELESQASEGRIRLYYADESHTCTEGYIPYGWQLQGEDVYVPSFRVARLNIFGMIDRDNRYNGVTTFEKMTADKVLSFLDEFSFNLEMDTFVVLDNASVHRNKKIKELRPIWEQRGLFLFFLPPYSPQLNIAETLWRILKGKWIRPQDYITSDILFYTTNRALADIGKGLRINFSKHVA